VDESPVTREAVERLRARLGRPAPVSATRLQKEFAWTREALEAVFRAAARENLLEIASISALPKNRLAKEAARSFRRCYGAKKIEKLVSALEREGLLRKVRAVVGPGTLFYRAGDPRPLVWAFRERLEKLGFSRPHIDEALGPVAKKPDAGDLPGRLLERIRALEEAPGVPVTVHSLRAAFPGIPKFDFDRAVLALADQGQVFLIQHDHGWALPEAEREALVHDGGTKLYVGVKLRH
jgi:hypothetical protein